MQSHIGITSSVRELIAKAGVAASPSDQKPLQQESLPSHNTPSINLTPSVGEGTIDFEALDNDFVNRPGLEGVCSLQRQDKMYMTCPRMTEIVMRVVSIQAGRLFRQSKRVIEATKADAADVEDMETTLIAQAEIFLNIIEKVRATQAFPKANKSLVRKFIKVFRWKLGTENGDYLDHFLDDWCMLTPTQRLESWVRLLPESSAGKNFMSMFEKEQHEDEVASYRSYGDSPLQKILVTVLISLVAIFYAVPMVILALDLVSPAGGVSISVSWLFVFSLVLLKVVPDEDMVLFLSVGYASLLGALMKSQDN